jgi:tetratricopeptide (TPR) repeat protein
VFLFVALFWIRIYNVFCYVNNLKGGQIMKPNYYFLWQTTCAIILAGCSVAFCSQKTDLTPFERYLLKGEWQNVINECNKVDPNELASSPVLRMIKGHACLVLNRNNESLILFLSISSEEERQSWLAWTTSFASQNSNNTVAYYLKGDALARKRNREGAIRDFSRALEVDPNFAPALNARGVIYANLNKFELALIDLKKACNVFPIFADAYSSLGTVMLSMNRDSEANKCFTEACQRSKDLTFGLATNGIGCTSFRYGPTCWKKANEEFETAGSEVVLPIALLNMDTLAQAMEDSYSKALLYFRSDQLVDWPALKEILKDPNGLFYSYFAKVKICEESPTRDVTDALNQILDDSTFYDKNCKKIQDASATYGDATDILVMVEKTKLARAREFKQLSGYERSAVRALNRTCLEVVCNNTIRKVKDVRPGMSIMQSSSLYDSKFPLRENIQYAQKIGVSTEQLAAANRRMESYGHLADMAGGIPVVGSYISGQWNKHLQNQTMINNYIIDSRVGDTASRAGGVSMEELGGLFFKQDEWKVANWYGLAYYSDAGGYGNGGS